MYIYKTKDKCEKCGVNNYREIAQLRCDYSGKLISDKYLDDNISYCKYKCDYGNMDTCFGSSGEEYEFANKYIGRENIHDFLGQPYMFFDDRFGDSEEANLLDDIVAGKLPVDDFPTFESILRYIRIETAIKLIESGEIKAEDLMFEVSDEV